MCNQLVVGSSPTPRAKKTTMWIVAYGGTVSPRCARLLIPCYKMKIKFNKEDFYQCFEFPVKYYLDETKSKLNRTTGQQRGLGSIINDFFLGKLIEIGVARAIEEKRNDKK